MRILFLLFLSFILLQSCKKYPNGPILSLRSREVRIEGNWSCEKVLVNSQESTPFYSKYSYNYGADGSFSENNGFNNLTGTWALTSDDDSLIVKINTTQALHRFKILRLRNKSMWLLEDRNTSTYEWHLKSN